MSLESDLATYLLAQAGVAAVIGTRLYRLVADQEAARPYAVLSAPATDPQRTLSGPNGEAVARLQIVCWGDTAAQADAALAAFRAALRALEALILATRQPATLGATRVRDVSDESDQELYADDVREPNRTLQFTVRYEE